MNSPIDYFQRLPKGKINGIFFLSEMRMEKGDSAGKIGHERNGEALPDSLMDPAGDFLIHIVQGLADCNVGVAVRVHGGGKSEETTDKRPKPVIAAAPRELIGGVGIQQDARGLRMNPLQFSQNLLRSTFLPEVKAQGEHFENGSFHEFCRGATAGAFPEALDPGSPFEFGDLPVQVGIDLGELIEPGEGDLRPESAGVYFRLSIHRKRERALLVPGCSLLVKE